MSDSKNSGRKSPVDRSNNEAEFPSTPVKNVVNQEILETGEARAKVGKSGSKS